MVFVSQAGELGSIASDMVVAKTGGAGVGGVRFSVFSTAWEGRLNGYEHLSHNRFLEAV